jgi:hypothetical protein
LQPAKEALAAAEEILALTTRAKVVAREAYIAALHARLVAHAEWLLAQEPPAAP